MFSLVWRFFPGPWWLRVFVMLLVAAALVYALVVYVYPYVAPYVSGEESTVNT